MAARNYTDPFVAHGIDISPEDQKILNHWSKAGPVSDGLAVPRLLPFENAMEYDDFIQDILPDFPGGKSVVLWDTDDISALAGYYYTGPMKGTVYVLHGPTDVSPKFLSLTRFYDYYCRILTEYTDDGCHDYSDKFFRLESMMG